ncbi:hypothetical protein [uncultured Anaerococcus sp.]|uniref:hypothetical protein n=1 Tax=uncultured Anaerococcus sp. TaxID=293428 RepID=UPI00288A0C78|nr:hypothetical protein [uncultured Anaerococcus sp.]
MTDINNQNQGEKVRRSRQERRREIPIDREGRLDAGRNLSWGSIIAGAVSGAAVFTVLSLLTAALGFGIFSATSANPFAGIGFFTGLWTAITLIISFCAGGFVAGYAARSTGLLHGAITWAVTVLLLFTLVFNAVATTLGIAGQTVGAVAGGAANIAGSALSGAGEVTSLTMSQAIDKVSEGMEAVDTKDLEADLEKYLEDTDVEELKPDYLKGQVKESKDEIAAAVKTIALNPESASSEIDKLTKSLSKKAEKIVNAANEDAIANAVAENTNLTEAKEIGKNIYEEFDKAAVKTSQSINQASDKINELAKEAKVTADEKLDKAKKGADKASNAVSIGSVLTFLGLIAALAISAIAGRKGEEFAIKNYR